MRTRRFPASMQVALTFTFLAGVGCARNLQQAPPGSRPSAVAPSAEVPKRPAERATSRHDVEDLELSPVFYEYDSHALSPDGRRALDRAAEVLRLHPELRIRIEGHCDERGTAEYNLALGERRAHAASEYLVRSGIPATRINIVSYGKERPFAKGHDELAWAQNRRAHLVSQ
jgi:peptidoglycan-associated lipoprotein